MQVNYQHQFKNVMSSQTHEDLSTAVTRDIIHLFWMSLSYGFVNAAISDLFYCLSPIIAGWWWYHIRKYRNRGQSWISDGLKDRHSYQPLRVWAPCHGCKFRGEIHLQFQNQTISITMACRISQSLLTVSVLTQKNAIIRLSMVDRYSGPPEVQCAIVREFVLPKYSSVQIEYGKVY
jgi:hypothetical protein